MYAGLDVMKVFVPWLWLI